MYPNDWHAPEQGRPSGKSIGRDGQPGYRLWLIARERTMGAEHTMAKRTVLIIEDDAAIRQGLVDAMEAFGYATYNAGEGKLALELALTCQCDLVLLDLVLPNFDGFDILREIRASRPTLPVIILTARGKEAERIRGLSLGADDYVVKPFSVQELRARIDAVLRRSPERPIDVQDVDLARGKADFERREVRHDDGSRSDLSDRETELLRYLVINAGRAVSRDEILRRVWQIDPTNLDTRTIDMTIARLREKLRDDPTRPRMLLTVRGKGYMWACREVTT
jgi:DNA-binding response OmpR family regulator